MRKLVLLFVAALLLIDCTTTEPTKPGKSVEYMARSEKRGVAYSFTRSDDLSALCPYISWDYNWGNTTNEEATMWFQTYNIEYCPMCWSGSYSPDRIRNFVAENPSTKYLLAFNEPNLTDQANMTPSQAAELWPNVVALAKELNLKLVAPAMNYGTLAGYSDPVKWLDEFFSKPGVSIDDIDAISLHCYMKSPQAVKGFIERFDKYGKPIWLTEFCAWDGGVGSVDEQMNYMCQMLNYLEQESRVERYSWFIPRRGQANQYGTAPFMELLTKTPVELTPLGKMYCWFSTFDKTAFLKTNRPIYAAEYMQTSDMAVQVRPCTDALIGSEGLMITSMTTMSPVRYQVSVVEDATSLEIRHTSFSNAMLSVKVDGQETFVDVPRTGSLESWQSLTIDMPIKAGNHTVTLELLDGVVYLSGFLFQNM